MPDPNNMDLPPPNQALLANRPPPLASPRASSEYILKDPGLIAAATTAVVLGQPLILAGEPGVGKTRFARKFAQICEIHMHDEIFVSTTAEGRGLLYGFDEIKRFRDKEKKPLASYVSLTSLGRAILWSAGPDAVAQFDPGADLNEVFGDAMPDRPLTLRNLFREDFEALDLLSPIPTGSHGGVESLVLLDEFDKAPRDAPNDLLGAVEKLRFRIDEIRLTIEADPAAWPVLVLTSNSERSLPDAFLRRCVFHWISFPSENDGLLQDIVAQHCRAEELLREATVPGDAGAEATAIESWRSSDFVRTSVRLLYDLRRDVVNKKPATAELLGFVSALLADGAGRTTHVQRDGRGTQRAIGALLKTKEDLRALGYLGDPV